MSSELVRFSISIPEDLLMELDEYSNRRGPCKNRSETVRDMIRETLVKDRIESPDAQVMATLTMVFDHHTNDLRDKLDDIQHAHAHEIVAVMHVHVDEHNCLETVIMRGRSAEIREIADALLGTKGVFNGDLMITTIGESHNHPHGHRHDDAE